MHRGNTSGMDKAAEVGGDATGCAHVGSATEFYRDSVEQGRPQDQKNVQSHIQSSHEAGEWYSKYHKATPKQRK